MEHATVADAMEHAIIPGIVNERHEFMVVKMSRTLYTDRHLPNIGIEINKEKRLERVIALGLQNSSLRNCFRVQGRNLK